MSKGKCLAISSSGLFPFDEALSDIWSDKLAAKYKPSMEAASIVPLELKDLVKNDHLRKLSMIAQKKYSICFILLKYLKTLYYFNVKFKTKKNII